MHYSFSGQSGLLLPKISLGLWHNFGSVDSQPMMRQILRRAFDLGITHFDLANNYGPLPGSAEENFGLILSEDFRSHRDQMIIASKAGHRMWEGPYGDGSSRKSLMASIDQSLRRTKLDYFDIFYSHRYDGVTPVEETMQALIDIVRQGKALYVGLSKYPLDKQKECYEILNAAHVPCIVSQYRYSMFDRISEGNINLAKQNGSGVICFSPLAQGLLSEKYLNGIPQDSRAAKETGFLRLDQVTQARVEAARKLLEIARRRNQTLPQMALAWILQKEGVTSVLIGASSPGQVEENVKAQENTAFTEEELQEIAEILAPLPDQL